MPCAPLEVLPSLIGLILLTKHSAEFDVLGLGVPEICSACDDLTGPYANEYKRQIKGCINKRTNNKAKEFRMSLFIDLLNCDPSSVVGGTFIAVVGCLLSYKLGRHNKRIEDFNSIRDQIEPMFKREVESPVPLFCDIDDSQLDILTSLMYPWQRKGFSDSIRAYQEAQGGEFESEKNSRTLKYKNPEPVSKAAAKVLTYLKRR